MSLRVEQCLHGYGDGHERLAASVALPDDEAYRLDRMSDLSGYPGKEDPPPYLSGYPAGRWYVVARTWIDPRGERRGTVFTHSILVPIEDVGGVADLASFTALFRQPTHPVERRGWEAPLVLPACAAPTIDPVAAAVWFEEETPLVWTGDDPEGAAASVWASLPSVERSDFRFCTHALLPRYLDERLFDWVAAPRTVVSEYGGARRHLRERDRASKLPAWLVNLRWPPDWRSIEADFPGLRRGDRRPALRFVSLRQRGGFDELLGATDLLERLRVAPGATTANGLFRALLSVAPEPDVAAFYDVLARDPLRWAPALEKPVGDWVYGALMRIGGTLDDAQVDRALTLGGTPAREALRKVAPSWPDERILARLARNADLIGEWIYRLPSERRRALLDAAGDPVRALLVSDLRALERLVEPGDPGWIDAALAMNDTRPDQRGLRAVLGRVGSEALVTWTRTRTVDDVPRVVIELIVEDALGMMLQQGSGSLAERALSLTEDDNLRECVRTDPSTAAAAWRALGTVGDPKVGRSRVARALLATGNATRLFALLAEDVDPFASIRYEDTGAILGAVLRASCAPDFHTGAASIREHLSFAAHVGHIARKDREWLAAEADVGETAAWIARTPSLARKEPDLVQDLIKAWSARGWSGSTSGDLLRILDTLDADSRTRAAAPLLDASLRLPQSADPVLVARTFSIVHEALLADKRTPFWVFDWFTDGWDKAKRPRRAMLRAWDEAHWPPEVLVQAFSSSKALEYCVDDLKGEVSAHGRRRFLTWLRGERPGLFRDLPRSLREEAERVG